MEKKKIKSTQPFFLPGWEKELEHYNLTASGLEKAYICSPLGAETAEKICNNMQYAREFMYYAKELFNVVTVAPHAYLPILLNDTVADERSLGMKFGVELLGMCQHIFVCGPEISVGMAAEIKYAAKEGIKIHVFNDLVHKEVEELCKGTKALINLHSGGEYVPLSVPFPKKYFTDKENFLRNLFK
ncbi:MAG: DUF4406 domain-containing protein [Acutalibacteraceae bacterium]|nr:DUF4406 domain-containing protein [Acutalibacteraceae bacterium]